MNHVNFFFEGTGVFDIPESIINEQVIKILSDHSKTCGEIVVIFCNDEYLLELNRRYLQHDYYTDIITFNYSEGKHIVGDLFISVERVMENAAGFDVSFLCELARVIFHGVLHLIGYDDNTNDEKAIMRQKEDHYLKGSQLKLTD